MTPGPSALVEVRGAAYGCGMRVRKGMRVRELSKRVGQPARRGQVLAVNGRSVEVRWDDGHRSSVTGSYLFPDFNQRA